MKWQLDKKMLDRLSTLKENTKAMMAILVIALLLDGAVFLRGQFSSVMRMFAGTGQLKTDIQTARRDIQSFSNYKSRLVDLKAELAKLNKRTIVEEEVPVVIETISKFADKSVVRILKIKPMIEQGQKAATSQQTGFRRIKIVITAKSGFHQLGRFIALLESAPNFLDIKSIDIRADEQEYMKQLVIIVLEVVEAKG